MRMNELKGSRCIGFSLLTTKHMATAYLTWPQRRREPLPPPVLDVSAPVSVPAQSILIFPSPPSEELLGSPSSPPPFSRGSTTLSIPTSLIASVDGNEPHIWTPSEGTSEWEAVGTTRPEPLTRDRVARLQSGLGWHSDQEPSVEVWDWSSPSSTPSSLVHGRRPLPSAPASTAYQSASSELHFSASASRSDAQSDFGSIFLVALRARDSAEAPESSMSSSTIFSSPRYFFRIPFESIIRFFFDIDPSTLDLLNQRADPSRPHPEINPTPSHLFTSHVPPPDEHNDVAPPVHMPSFPERPAVTKMITDGFGALEATSVSTNSLIFGAMRVPFMIAKSVFVKA